MLEKSNLLHSPSVSAALKSQKNVLLLDIDRLNDAHGCCITYLINNWSYQKIHATLILYIVIKIFKSYKLVSDRQFFFFMLILIDPSEYDESKYARIILKAFRIHS